VTSRPQLSLDRETWLLSREGVALAALGLSVVALLFVTSAVVARHHATWERLGVEWFERGESALAEGRPEEALSALRTALVYDRENERYHFRLAQALLAGGRTAEARAYLRGLAERQPGAGPVQLELARLAASSGNTTAAAAHYRAAIQGLWEEAPEERRLQLRLELAQMLVQTGAAVEAQSELVAAAARLPDDPAIRSRVADLFRRAGDDRRAYEEFRQTLRASPTFAPALLGAGRTALALRDWRAAVVHLRRAEKQVPGDPLVAELLGTAESVLAADPFLERLSIAEKARRGARAVEAAKARLAACTAAAPDPDLDALAATLETLNPTERGMRRQPEGVLPAMDLVYAIEKATAARCGPPEGLDRALLVLAGSREGEA